MAKKKEENSVVDERRNWSTLELFYLENNRHLQDEEIASFLNIDVGEVTLIRTETNFTYEPKKVEPTSLFFDEELRVWKDNDGNIYDGPPVKSTDDKTTVEVKKNVAAGLTAGDFFGRNGIATVMTPAAAQMSDFAPRGKTLPSSCVHRPKAKR